MIKNISILILFLTLQSCSMAQTETSPKPKLIYFGDPMCSWCYGFSPEITAAMDSLSETVDFQLVMGGLRPYNTQTMKELGNFLQHHWEDVGKRSGQHFSYEILKDTTFVYDTEPACRAVVVMRELQPKSEFDFFKKIQTSFYKENKNTNLTSTYAELATEYGLDKNTFAQKFESDEMKQKVREDFVYSNEAGVRGFPSIVLQHGENYYLIANGYLKANQLIEKVNSILK